jgi:hypothetical protein
MRTPCLAAASATRLLPQSDLRSLLRMSAEYRQQIEEELARALERDTEPCDAPDHPLPLLVDVKAGGPVYLGPPRVPRIVTSEEGYARLVELANSNRQRREAEDYALRLHEVTPEDLEAMLDGRAGTLSHACDTREPES